MGPEASRNVRGSVCIWATSTACAGTVFYLLPFHLIPVYFGFLGKVPWKSVIGKVVVTCFSFASSWIFAMDIVLKLVCNVIMTSACLFFSLNL